MKGEEKEEGRGKEKGANNSCQKGCILSSFPACKGQLCKINECLIRNWR